MVFCVKPAHNNKGFTILEILVVVAVISIIASTIMLSTRFSRPEDDLKKHANTIGKTLQLLMQEAILEDRNYALSITKEAYFVLEYDGQEWVQSKDKFFLALQKKHSFSHELVVDKSIVSIEKKEKLEPHILILASGEMSVFEWEIQDRDHNLQIRLTSTMFGKITMEGPAQSLL